MYTLGGITLPNPVGFTRKYLETGVANISINGKITKDISNRKEKFILEYQNLTPAEVNSILSEYTLEATRNFTVTETNLTIGATAVHIEIEDREYQPGNEYRENLKLILTEVE